MKRAKAISQRRENAIEEKKKLLKNIESAESLEIKQEDHFAEVLLRVSDLALAYGDNTILTGLNFTIEKGDRIAVVGGNGSGKSTLIHAVTMAVQKDLFRGRAPEIANGLIKPSKDLIVSYVSQDTSMLNGSLRDYAKTHGIDEGLFKSMLSKLDFNVIQFEKDMSQFSEGQKKKVLLARSICDRAHIYIWDEPLNYVDILSRIQLEEMLLTYKPTMIFVEHDEAFIENIATRIISLDA